MQLLHVQSGEPRWSQARCRSWRHDGSQCQRWRSQQDFSRVREGLRKFPVEELTLAVLTLDQSKWIARGMTPADAYKGLMKMWKKLDQYLCRNYGGFWPHITTLEAHRPEKGGWPHLNVILTNPLVAAMVRADADATLRWWKDEIATRFGFGWRVSIEPVYDRDGVAAYVTKYEGHKHAGGAAGEVVKMAQAPLNAPPGTRRLRASKGVLPPVLKSGEYTGTYVAQPLPELQHQRQQRAYAELGAHLGVDLHAKITRGGRVERLDSETASDARTARALRHEEAYWERMRAKEWMRDHAPEPPPLDVERGTICPVCHHQVDASAWKSLPLEVRERYAHDVHPICAGAVIVPRGTRGSDA